MASSASPSVYHHHQQQQHHDHKDQSQSNNNEKLAESRWRRSSDKSNVNRHKEQQGGTGVTNCRMMMIHPKKICNFVFRRNQTDNNPVYKSESFRFIQKTDSFLLPASRRSFKVPVSENYVDPIDRHSAAQNGKEEPPYHEISERYNAPYYYSDTIKEDPSYCSPCTVQRTDSSSGSSTSPPPTTTPLPASSSSNNETEDNNIIMKKPERSSCKSSQCCNNNIKMTVKSVSNLLHQKEEGEDDGDGGIDDDVDDEDLLTHYHPGRRRHQFISICQIRNSPSSTMTSSSGRNGENCVKRVIISDNTNNNTSIPELYSSSQPEQQQQQQQQYGQSCFNDCDRRRLKIMTSGGDETCDRQSPVMKKSENKIISNGAGNCPSSSSMIYETSGGQMIMINSNDHFIDHYGVLRYHHGEPSKAQLLTSSATVEESSSRSSTISSCVDSGICLDDTLSSMNDDNKSKSIFCRRHQHHHQHQFCDKKGETNEARQKNFACSCPFCDTALTKQQQQQRVDHFYARVGRNLSCDRGGGGDNKVGESQQQDHFTNVKCANNNNNIQHHKRSEKVAPQIAHNEPPPPLPLQDNNNDDDDEEQEQICNNNLMSQNNAGQLMTMMGDINLLLCSSTATAAAAAVAAAQKKDCCIYYVSPQCYSDLANQYRLALDPSVKLESQDWFHGRITRVEAESMLKTARVASFLVRNCEKSKQNHFSLSIKCSSGFIHIRIEPNPDGTYTLAEQEFPSVPHLIQHFMLHRLPIKGAQHLKLEYPVITQFL